MVEKEITIELKHPEIFFLLVALTVFLVLELMVMVPSPIAFGDEGFHTYMGRWMAENLEFPKWIPCCHTKLELGKNAYFSHHQTWHLTEAGFFLLSGSNDVIIKFLVPFIASILLGITIYVLVKRIVNTETGIFAALITVTVPSIVTYAILSYTDILFTLYFSLAFLTYILALKDKKKKYWILTGIFSGLAFLTKIVGVVMFPFLLLGFLYQFFTEKKFLELLKTYAPIFIFLILIISPFFLRSWVFYKRIPVLYNLGINTAEVKTEEPVEEEVYKFEGRTEQVGTEASMFKIGIMNYLNFAYGNIWFVPFTFVCGLILLYIRKDKIGLILFLIILSFIPVFRLSIFGRAEDTARYNLGLTPVIAIISGIYLTAAYTFIKNYRKEIAMVLFVLVFVLSFLNLNDKLYAARHFEESVGQYVGYKMFVPSFFDGCNFIKENTPEDSLIMTVWVYRAIYNCERNSVGSQADIELSGDVDFALERLKEKGITHIFIQKFGITDQSLSEKYPIGFIKMMGENPENFKKLYETGPNPLDCVNVACDGVIVYEVVF